MTSVNIIGYSCKIKVRNKASNNDLQLCLVRAEEPLKGIHKTQERYHPYLRYIARGTKDNFFRLSKDIVIVNFAREEHGDITPLSAKKQGRFDNVR